VKESPVLGMDRKKDCFVPEQGSSGRGVRVLRFNHLCVWALNCALFTGVEDLVPNVAVFRGRTFGE
jgi:hypothetical protein